MTAKVTELQKISLTDMKDLRLFVNILTGDDKYSLLNSDNFYEINSDAIKQKTFSHFVSAFLQIRLNFNNFEKNILPL